MSNSCIKPSPVKSFLVTIKDSDGDLTLNEAEARLKGTGLQVDQNYGVISLGGDDFVIRAEGTDFQAKRADSRVGIDVFADSTVVTFEKGGGIGAFDLPQP